MTHGSPDTTVRQLHLRALALGLFAAILTSPFLPFSFTTGLLAGLLLAQGNLLVLTRTTAVVLHGRAALALPFAWLGFLARTALTLALLALCAAWQLPAAAGAALGLLTVAAAATSLALPQAAPREA
jgi:hypothetical protein